MIEFKQYYQFLNEGGAGGHMPHPFDLPDITTGKRLLGLFDKIVKHIKKKSAATKLDGINVSVRLIKTEKGLEWAMDRGSMKPIDLEGITIDRLREKFPPKISQDPVTGDVAETPHGMVKAGEILLSILNAALPDIEKEIKQLGLTKSLDGHDALYINTEFIEHTGTNVVKYGKNFIAFHGINKFDHITGTNPKTGRLINRREGGEVNYNGDAFERFINKVQIHSAKKEFDTHGVIPVRFLKEPDFTSALSSKIEIKLTPAESQTKTLEAWLLGARNPYKTNIKMHGQRVLAMQKKVYQYVIGEDGVSVGPLSEAFDENDVKTAIDASIFWHATRLLGIQVNSALETHHGDVVPVGEGIVIRDLPSGRTRVVGDKRIPIPYPAFKITGEFIISGLMSNF